MAAGFVKVAADLDSNPKIRRAGRAGREVFLFVLRRTNLLERDGRCSLSNVDPWYLADQLQMPEGEAAEGLQRAIAAGLIAIDGGQVVVCGWDDEWAKRPAEGAERTERWRNKRRVEHAPATSRSVTAASGDGAAPTTSSHATSVTPVTARPSPVTDVTPDNATPSHVTVVTSPNVTQRHGASPSVTESHGDESDGSDQIRSDQIRVDYWESAPSARNDTRPRDAPTPAVREHRASRASRAARSAPMPVGWAPRSEELALAKTLRVDPAVEALAFRDHHSAKGSRFVDWDAAFRTWLRNAAKFSRGGAPPPGPSFFEIIDALPVPPPEVHP